MRHLQSAVKSGMLREDFYYRISVMPIKLPPLRVRRKDLAGLALHFLQREAAAMGREANGFTEAAMQKILSYPWPGNVRELENRIKQGLVLASGGEIDDTHLHLEDERLLHEEEPAAGHAGTADFFSAGNRNDDFRSFNESRSQFEKKYLAEVLRRNRGNATAAARESGKHRSEFYDLLKRHGLQPSDFRVSGGSDKK